MPVNYNPIPAYPDAGIFSPECVKCVPVWDHGGFSMNNGSRPSPGYPNPIYMKANQRLFLYTADLIALTGKSYRSCRRMYVTLLDCVGKDSKKKLTIGEYCRLEDLDEMEVRKHLKLT